MKQYQPYYRSCHCVHCGDVWNEQVAIVEDDEGYMHEARIYCRKCNANIPTPSSFAKPLPLYMLYDVIDYRMKHDKTLSKADLVNMHNLVDRFRAFDYAIPQPWVTEMQEVTQEINISGHFVWVYEENDAWGKAYPLTKEGMGFLDDYDAYHKGGSEWAV